MCCELLGGSVEPLATASGCGLLLAGLLLASHGLLLALAGTGVGLRPLTVHGQAPAVPDPLIAADLDLAPDVRLDFPAQVALDAVGRVDPVAQANQILFGQLVHPGVRADPGRLKRLSGPGPADAVNVSERDLHPLIAGEINADEACHVRAVLLRLLGGPPRRS